ncbi:hypothetical protein AMK59_5666 [Oryctes borbonicus]|uniref:MRN complex-interacting protein N-terminal domain-containing protein n=1 Tax=Oryctes borbonicus TaxID=1629725 RepID=A0A0T6B2Y0_9SCAR|nr:hypothetical protein AMK59_5666 [Oryctes borbonicus]
MPQELHVVRCYNCEAFQVDIVKKVPKWICKICGEKQSLKKVYAKGTGKECREFVKDLNEQRLSLPTTIIENSLLMDSEIKSQSGNVISDSNERKRSKWSEYMVRDVTDCGNAVDDCLVKRPKLNEDIFNNTSSKWNTFLTTNESSLETEEFQHYKYEKPENLQYFKDTTIVSNVYDNKFGSASDLDIEFDF